VVETLTLLLLLILTPVLLTAAKEAQTFFRMARRSGSAQVFSNVEDTGLPGLRSYLHEITGKQQVAGAKRMATALTGYFAGICIVPQVMLLLCLYGVPIGKQVKSRGLWSLNEGSSRAERSVNLKTSVSMFWHSTLRPPHLTHWYCYVNHVLLGVQRTDLQLFWLFKADS
jgi:hypothetical protein